MTLLLSVRLCVTDVFFVVYRQIRSERRMSPVSIDDVLCRHVPEHERHVRRRRAYLLLPRIFLSLSQRRRTVLLERPV